MNCNTIEWSWKTSDGEAPEDVWGARLEEQAWQQIGEQAGRGLKGGALSLYGAIHPKLRTPLVKRCPFQLRFSLSLAGPDAPEVVEFVGSWRISEAPPAQMIDDLVRATVINSLSSSYGAGATGVLGEQFEGPKHQAIVERANRLKQRHNLRGWKVTTLEEDEH